MITIEWNAFPPHVVSDAGVEDFVREIIDRSKSEKDFSVEIGQEIVFDAIRLSIIEDRIDFKNIQFVFGEKVFEPNELGQLNNYPNELLFRSELARKIIEKSFDIRNGRGD